MPVWFRDVDEEGGAGGESKPLPSGGYGIRDVTAASKFDNYNEPWPGANAVRLRLLLNKF